MTISYKHLITVLGIVGVIACANQQVERDIEQQAATQPVRSPHGELADKGLEAFEASPSLTANQKQALLNLQQRMMKDTFRNQEETSKLKSVLFETLAMSPYDGKKVTSLKKRLTTLNDQKMSNMFSALSEAEKILGYLPDNEKKNVYSNLLRESPRGDVY